MLGSTVAPPTPCGDYEIALEELASMTRDQNNSALHEYGGVSQSISKFLLMLFYQITFTIFTVSSPYASGQRGSGSVKNKSGYRNHW